MISGIGVDIVAIDRMAGLSEHALVRMFHPDEFAQALAISSGVSSGRNQFLAGRFAAKEALGKALGTGLMDIALQDICTRNDPQGRPYLELYGNAKEKLAGRQALLSISHDAPMAIAVVLLQDPS